ncbi:adenosine deaminase [Romboutsia maritimum]|uniref:Adenosine deaminase n=1 Tax=Romboutsia maritimum TaxID=2020948 RepID=A0A371ITE4_9FIRM|nr:adenosine deaminase [Romboutsia maritimum]RDY23725.1 adenosine deaminase [Romboutsia maritimum]
MIKKLPKIELHCHLDGSVRLDTIIDIAKKENIKLPSEDINELSSLVKVPSNCTSLVEYLKRFDLPNKIMQTKESLRRISFELLEDAQRENVKYLEIRFAPMLHLQRELTISEVIESVICGMKEAQEKYDIKSNLILGCMRTMSEEDAILVINEGKKFLNKGVVAVDLCGPELEGFSSNFKNAMDLARSYGYKVTIHAGEAASENNVLDAINLLGAKRIGHGVRIKDKKEVYKLVKEKNIVLEMCPTSNVQTKAIDAYENHPFYPFYKDDIKVTISTDNRTVSDIDLSSEIDTMFNKFDLKRDDYKKIYLNSVDATFADDKTKNWLRSLI